jgi:hypothetical protein
MKNKLLFLIILISILLYLPSLNNYFSGDDWFHFEISQVQTLPQFLNFFSFHNTLQSAAFYRPLPTQVFFFVFQSLFGLNPLPYHLFTLLIFGISLYLVFLFVKTISNDQRVSLLTTFFYGISVTNFTRLYFLSAFQEISLVVFCLLSLLFYLRHPRPFYSGLSITFFIFALLSKETAVILPIILIIVSLFKKHSTKKTLPYFLILIPYLFLRLVIFQSPGGDSYFWNPSPLKAINTLFWYLLWSIGAPEILVDYVTNGLRIIPRFFTDFNFWAYITLSFLGLSITAILLLLFRNLKSLNRYYLFSLLFFIISLLPVLFLPSHKFTLELTLPLIGSCLFLALLTSKRSTLSLLTIILLISLNLSMNLFTYQRHYSVNRSKTAHKISDYFITKYPTYPNHNYFEFVNDTPDFGQDWGSSKQISHITSGSNMFRVLYHDQSIKIYFEDIPEERPVDKQKIMVSTLQFFQ